MPSSNDDVLAEHRAALAKIDAAVASLSTRAGDALSCKRGCDGCCVDGLSVLPVEAALIEAHSLAEDGARGGASRALEARPGMCAFLDVDGACTVYAARPVLCRTHGLALKSTNESDGERASGLRVLADDVSACALNYRERAPVAAEILDATALMMLLVTVDRRYRARVGLPDDTARVPLRDLAAKLR